MKEQDVVGCKDARQFLSGYGRQVLDEVRDAQALNQPLDAGSIAGRSRGRENGQAHRQLAPEQRQGGQKQMKSLFGAQPRGQSRSQNRNGDCLRISRSSVSMLAACGSSNLRQSFSVTANIKATAAKKRL